MRGAIPEFRTIESSAEVRQIEEAVLSALLLCDEVLRKAENAIRSYGPQLRAELQRAGIEDYDPKLVTAIGDRLVWEQLGRVDGRLREIYPDAELP